MPKILKSYIDFRGGLNVDSTPDNLADNELEQADNCILDPRGGVHKRKGTAWLNAVSYGAQVERLIEWHRDSGAQVLLGVVGTTLKQIADDGTATDVQALAGTEIGHAVFKDKLYFVDGAEYRVYDGTTSEAVTANTAADNDLTPIKRCTMMLRHPASFRFFAAGDPQNPSALYFSEPNDPTYFKDTRQLVPTSGDGPLTAVALFGDAVIAFFAHSVWVYRGVDPASDARWSRLPVGHGTVSPRSIAIASNALLFLGEGGLYAISPGMLDYNVTLAPGERLVPNVAENKVTSLIRGMVHKETACAVWDAAHERYILAYGDDPTNLHNNRALVLQFPFGGFTRLVGFQANDYLRRVDGSILFATDGHVTLTDQGFNDADGTAVALDLKTKQWALDYPFHRKKVAKVFLAALQYDTETSHIDLAIKTECLSKSFPAISTDESFVWGDVWGGVWGFADVITKEARVNLKGQRFQAIVSNNTLNEPITFYGIAFQHKVLRPKGVRV